MDGKRTVVGTCVYCEKPLIAQEPEYVFRTAPTERYHRHIPSGMWRCPVTGIEHIPAHDVRNDQLICTICESPLIFYWYRDNLTGLEKAVFLYQYVVEEDPC